MREPEDDEPAETAPEPDEGGGEEERPEDRS
jgi:hypothetical protein